MQKVLWLILSFMMIAEARENPFETTMSPTVVGKTTQIPETRENFVNTTLKLPSSARILKSATVTFQNLDGSISEEIVAIDQNVDWHYPLLLSTQTLENNVTSKSVAVPPAPVSEMKKNIEVKKEQPTINLKQTENTHSYQFTDTISLLPNGNEISIFTKESKIRDFLIADPYKVVVDFKKESSFGTKTLTLSTPPFVSATLGNHEGFYRIAILLDGHYRYDILPFNGGYIIKLK